jgi:hypothetical protein
MYTSNQALSSWGFTVLLSPENTRIFRPNPVGLWAYLSTTCNACQPGSQAHQGTIAAHPIPARHIPGTAARARDLLSPRRYHDEPAGPLPPSR